MLYEIGADYSTGDNPDDLQLSGGTLPGSTLQGQWSNTTWDVTGADTYLDRLGYKPMDGKKANVAMKGIWSNTYNDATVDYSQGAFSVMVMNGLKNNDQSGGKAIIRLPKEDTMYDYYQFSETGADDGGTDTGLNGVQTDLNRARNRGRLKTDLLLPLVDNSVVSKTYQQIQRTETTASRYGDQRTYTRVPWTVGTNALPMTAANNNPLRAFTEDVSAGVSNMGYYLVENPFQTGVQGRCVFADPDDLVPDLRCGIVPLFGIYMRCTGDDPVRVRVVRQHPLDQFSKPVDIRADIRGRKSVLLRRGDAVRSHQDRVFLFAADIDLGGVIVNDLDHTVLCQHDIGRLQVAVDDAF